MKKILFGVLAVAFVSGISYAADVQQQDASIGLAVPQIIELVGIDMSESITPGPEDYARDLQVARVVNDSGGMARLIYAKSVNPAGNEARIYVVPEEYATFPATTYAALTAGFAAGHHSLEKTWRPGLWAELSKPGVNVAGNSDFPSNGVTGDVTSAGLAWIQNHWRNTDSPPLGPANDTWSDFTSKNSGISNNTGNEAAVDNAMYDANNDIGKGFAERTDALAMTIFTNAQDGAALYVHGLQPAQQQGILRLEDTYVSVCTEKTYILQNDLEGAYANACSKDVMEQTATAPSNIQRVEDNPRNNDGGGTYQGQGADTHAGAATDKAYSTWLRLHNQAQHLFEVKMSTKAPRLVVVNLGIANLARYTEGEYTNTLTFTLMPIVG